MKKKLMTIIAVTLVIASIATITVFATKSFKPSWLQKKMDKGFTEDDAYKIMAMAELSGEKISKRIEKQYKKTNDWAQIAEHYDVDMEEFNNLVSMKKKWIKELDMPEKIYNEMKAEGMTDDECMSLSEQARNFRIDIKKMWKEIKKGKTTEEIIKEDTKMKNAMLTAAADCVYGKITEKEYIKRAKELDSDMSKEEIIAFLEENKAEWVRASKESSGITEEEIALAESMGITDIIQLCRIKDREIISDLSFEEMLEQVKQGQEINTVLKNSVSETKIKAHKEKIKGKTE